jgi:hypothetical protein
MLATKPAGLRARPLRAGRSTAPRPLGRSGCNVLARRQVSNLEMRACIYAGAGAEPRAPPAVAGDVMLRRASSAATGSKHAPPPVNRRALQETFVLEGPPVQQDVAGEAPAGAQAGGGQAEWEPLTTM